MSDGGTTGGVAVDTAPHQHGENGRCEDGFHPFTHQLVSSAIRKKGGDDDLSKTITLPAA